MIKKEDIKMVLDSTRADFPTVTASDVAFLVLCDTFAEKDFAYRVAYGKKGDGEALYISKDMQRLLAILEPFGVGKVTGATITKEQNKQDLIKLLARVQKLGAEKAIDIKDALKLEGDLRVKLNDKFEMEENQNRRRIIIVPSKHDILCPHTNRECNFWPTKNACMKHYNLKEEKKDEQKKTDDNQ